MNVCDADGSVYTFCQSPLESMSKPTLWYQSELPAASHCFAFFSFAVNGAMNCALMSGGETSTVVESERSYHAFVVVGWRTPS